MGENVSALVSLALLAMTFVPIAVLLNSIPQGMLNWPVVYAGGVVCLAGLFGLVLMANKEYLFKKPGQFT